MPVEPVSSPAFAARLGRSVPGLAIWAAGWGLMLWLDGRFDLSNLAMVLVATSALATLWLTVSASLLLGALSVMGFNWAFVPPRHGFSVDLTQHAVLLCAMLILNGIVAALMAARQRQAERARRLAVQAEQLRTWGDRLRDADDPTVHAGTLQELLSGLGGEPAVVMVLGGRARRRSGAEQGSETGDDEVLVGVVDADQRAGLRHCQRQGAAMGPGTGRHSELPEWYLPLRGRGLCMGAALVRGRSVRHADEALRNHAQALCDQLGLALQRMAHERDEAAAREQAQTQAVRNALLAAISHDYRTPLATIMGAASSLESQAERLSVAQRHRLARSIVDETEQLSRLTDNTLQLARLDAPGVSLRCDWESAEDIVGAVLGRVRRHDPERRVHARLEPDLPLLWCDGLLLGQMLDNLIDNALKYSPTGAPVEVLVRRLADQVVLAVRDRGPGIAPAWRERIFEVFHRGAGAVGGAVAVPREALARRGAGVGLAVCRAIAHAHGGELRLRARGHGGSSFECLLPVRPAPPPPEDDESAELGWLPGEPAP